MKRFLAIYAVLTAVAVAATAPIGPAAAVEPDEVLDNPALEARAREISKELRCVVCQNQSIDDSHADIARDMRLVVRERLVAGDGDTEVIAYMVARYGDFVLLRPPFQTNTLALWIGPPLLALIIAILGLLYFRAHQRQRTAQAGPPPLSPADRAQLDALVEQLAAEPPAPRRRGQLRQELEQPFGKPANNDDGDTGPQ